MPRSVTKNVHFQDVRDWGAVGDDVTDDTAAIQACIDYCSVMGQANFGDGRSSVVYFPAGKYRTSAPIGVTGAGDGNVGLTVTGPADGVTAQIRAFDQSHPVMQFSTPTGNMRGLRVENLMLRNGSIGLVFDRVKNSNVHNLTTFQQGELALYVENGGNNLFADMNLVQTTNDTMELIGGTGDEFANCQIGELSGNILVSGCPATFNGGRFGGSWDRRNPDGYNAMGPAMFTVIASGSLRVNGVHLNPQENLVNCQNHRAVTFSDCYIHWDSVNAHDGHLISVDTNTRGGETSLRSNAIVLTRAGSNMAVIETRIAARFPTNSVVADNAFHILDGNTVTIDDDLNNPNFGNQILGNTINFSAVV